jgi:hypothetical protein
MKKIVKGVRSSSHDQFVILGITLLWAALAVVAVSATPKAFASQASEQNAGSPGGNPVVQQDKSKLYAQPVRMVGEGILGPVGLGGIDRPARIPKSLNPTANALINNNNGSTGTATSPRARPLLSPSAVLLLSASTIPDRSTAAVTSLGGPARRMAVPLGPTAASCPTAKLVTQATR